MPLRSRVRVNLEGADRLITSMRYATGQLGRVEGVEEGAGRVAEDARGRAPKRRGTLAANIRARRLANNLASVESGVVYGGVQEFGWPKRRIPAQPHIYPALRANRRGIVAEVREGVLRILAKVKGA